MGLKILSIWVFKPLVVKIIKMLETIRQSEKLKLSLRKIFYLIHLKGKIRKEERGWDRNRERDLQPLVPPQLPQWSGPDQAKTRSQSFIWVFLHCCRGPSTEVTFCCFPRYISSELDQKQVSQHSSQLLCGMPALQVVTSSATPQGLKF